MKEKIKLEGDNNELINNFIVYLWNYNHSNNCYIFINISYIYYFLYDKSSKKGVKKVGGG